MGFKAAAQIVIVAGMLIATCKAQPPQSGKYGSTILHDDGDDIVDAFGWSSGANRTDELYGYMYDRLPAWRLDWEPLLSVEPDLVYFIQHWNVDEQ